MAMWLLYQEWERYQNCKYAHLYLSFPECYFQKKNIEDRLHREANKQIFQELKKIFALTKNREYNKSFYFLKKPTKNNEQLPSVLFRPSTLTYLLYLLLFYFFMMSEVRNSNGN